jgi:Cu+-exporting ATPase
MTGELLTVELSVRGMDCGNCALGIEKKLRSLGIAAPTVNFATATARFEIPFHSSAEPFIKAIEELGYEVEHPSAPPPSRVRFTLEQKAGVSALFTIPLFLGHMLPGMPHIFHSPTFQLILCLPVFLIGLTHFGSSALRSLRARFANMDVLIVIGLVASFGYSLYGTVLGLGAHFLFYETTATIATLVLIGNLIEARAVRRTSSAIEELARLQPERARKVDTTASPQQIVEIDARSVAPGDLLLVNSGDKVPADGTIVSGNGLIDESMITGESIPVERGIAESVIGGTIVCDGSFTFRANGIGDSTVLARIIRLVKEAQTNKPAIQRLGDTVSSIFVPVTLSIALATFLVSVTWLGLSYGEALIRAVAVLVIACPCAMGLATPTAVMVGVGRAARSGILLKGGSTLEEFASIRTIVFDKTGTLTTGDFTVGELKVFGREERFVQSLIASLEYHSSHPIATSLVRAFSDAPRLPLQNLQEEKGLGISGQDERGVRYRFGSRTLARIPANEAPPGALYLLEEDTVIARLILHDTVKPEAAQTIATLRSLGITPVMVSGDSETRCREVAREVGIEAVYAEHLPDDKLRVIKELEQRSATAFVGDGVNDAPALAGASVGVSLSNGTTVAIESARIVLLGGNLAHLPIALRLARATLTTIRQNLFWAFSYNIIAIPMAAAGYLTPTVAAIAMGFSDVMTIGNSMRLRRRRI